MHSLMHKLERGDYMSRVLKHNVGDDVALEDHEYIEPVGKQLLGV